MKVRLHQTGLGEVKIVENVRTMVVYDSHDQPILAASMLEGGHMSVSTAKDSDFANVLRALGIGLNATIRVLK